MDCNNYNQYRSDVKENGKLIPDKCFKGSIVYKPEFNFNNYQTYKSKEYYKWINQNMVDYSFKPDYINKTFDNLCNIDNFSLKPQQKLAARIINTHVKNSGMLIYHGLGSGKTITSIIIGEAFKFRTVSSKKVPSMIIPGRTDTIILIVVPSSLIEQYYSEIIGNIYDGIIKSATGEVLIYGNEQFYLNETTRNSIVQNNTDITRLTEEINVLNENKGSSLKIKELQELITTLRLQIRFRKDEEKKNINKVYEIISHDTFLNRLLTIKNGIFTQHEFIKNLEQANGLLIIDEIHGLVSAIGTSYRKLLFAIKYHSNPNFKVVLLTGTPIYDKPYEFGLTINLLRPRILFPDGPDDFNEVFLNGKEMQNVELFKKMCSGYISYFKGGNPEAYPYKKVILMNHAMQPYQYSEYKQELVKEIDKDKKSKDQNKEEFIVKMISSESKTDETTTSVFNNSRLICNIAFPEIKLTDQQKKLTRERISQLKVDEFKKILKEVFNVSTRDNLEDLDIYKNIIKTVANYSSKFAKVAELLLQSDGTAYIYSNYVYYGVDPMAIVLDFVGFREFPLKGKNGSYFIWKGATKKQDSERAKSVFNSKKNNDGSLLKIILGTPSIMEGVDFKNVRQIHILDPWWNDSRMQQLIGRGVRLCSHRDLLPKDRIVNVFIHLSTLGSGETLFEVKYNKRLSNGEIVLSKVKTTFQRTNIYDKDSKNWMFYESGTKIDKEGNLSIYNINDSAIPFINIVSYTKIADPVLTSSFGAWKQLDARSVEQYMYARALEKLYINRQFENVIKQVAIDCDINKFGNILRLEEKYLPYIKENLYNLEYENYSNGDKFLRLGVRSAFIPDLPDGVLSLQDIFNNTAKLSGLFRFQNKETGEIITLPDSLIISENINCENIDYSFNFIPEKIKNMTLNKELIPNLMKIKLEDFKQYFFDVEKLNVSTVTPNLKLKIKKFYSKESLDEKQVLIDKLQTFNVGVDQESWELYTLPELKKIYREIFKKNVNE